MTTTVAIVGLGQIGASIGLALKGKPGAPKVLGYSRDAATAREAENMGAVDSATGVKEAVRDAQIVFLCLPLSEMQEAIERIGPGLKEGAVLVDTVPIKGSVAKWVAEFVPVGRYYLGLVPAVNTSALASMEGGIKGARADLFDHTIMIITTPPGTPAEVEQLGMNVAQLLGAKPMLTDPVESDGIMTTAHVLPQLAAAALVEACVSAPGWAESRKLAGQPFAGVSGGIGYYDDPHSIEVAAFANPSTVVHALDVMIAALQGLRDDIDRGDQETVGKRLMHSYVARSQWLDERGEAAWLAEGGQSAELPPHSEQIMQMLFGGGFAPRPPDKRAKSTNRA